MLPTSTPRSRASSLPSRTSVGAERAASPARTERYARVPSSSRKPGSTARTTAPPGRPSRRPRPRPGSPAQGTPVPREPA
ncbi:MAG: hypothetical protein MZU97_12180 [Bacillus subtilis]|nr:hypothetical protein [Bacillus subtilis]